MTEVSNRNFKSSILTKFYGKSAFSTKEMFVDTQIGPCCVIRVGDETGRCKCC